MDNGIIAVGVSILGLLGQLANCALNWKIRAGQLEMERRILDRVEERYVEETVCSARMAGVRAGKAA